MVRVALRESFGMGDLGRLGLAFLLLMALVTAAGCAVSQKDAGVPAAVEESPASAVGKRLASITDAFGEEFHATNERVLADHPDLKLLGARTTSSFRPDHAGSWAYLYVSLQEQYCYVLFPDTEGDELAPYADYEITEEQWETIPDVEDIVVSADEAFDAVMGAVPADTPLETCQAYLLFFISNYDGATMKPMTWYLDFNLSGSGERAAESFSYAVDAQTGDASVVV